MRKNAKFTVNQFYMNTNQWKDLQMYTSVQFFLKNYLYKYHKAQKIALHKTWSFPWRISSVNVTKSTGSCWFGPFAVEILQGKLPFLCSDTENEEFPETHAVACLYSFRVSILSPYNFTDLISTCLLHLKYIKFFLSIFLELILIKLDSLIDA